MFMLLIATGVFVLALPICFLFVGALMLLNATVGIPGIMALVIVGGVVLVLVLIKYSYQIGGVLGRFIGRILTK